MSAEVTLTEVVPDSALVSVVVTSASASAMRHRAMVPLASVLHQKKLQRLYDYWGL